MNSGQSKATLGKWGHPGELGGRKYFSVARVYGHDVVSCCPDQGRPGAQSRVLSNSD